MEALSPQQAWHQTRTSTLVAIQRTSIPSDLRPLKLRCSNPYRFTIHEHQHCHSFFPVDKSLLIRKSLIGRLFPTCRAPRTSHRKTALALVETLWRHRFDAIALGLSETSCHLRRTLWRPSSPASPFCPRKRSDHPHLTSKLL